MLDFPLSLALKALNSRSENTEENKEKMKILYILQKIAKNVLRNISTQVHLKVT